MSLTGIQQTIRLGEFGDSSELLLFQISPVTFEIRVINNVAGSTTTGKFTILDLQAFVGDVAHLLASFSSGQPVDSDKRVDPENPKPGKDKKAPIGFGGTESVPEEIPVERAATKPRAAPKKK